MIKFNTIFASIAILAIFPACADDDGDDNNVADASATVDSMTANPDAPSAELSGLGEICNPASNDLCMSQATPVCLSLTEGADGFCSLSCGMGVVVTSDANGGIPIHTAGNPACEAAFEGDVGTPLCAIIVGGANPPPPEGASPETEYTIDLGCAVLCPDGMCPGDLTCSGGLCQP